ncbi:uncharacterized protein MELLADRAFT_70927 [Melampsora larici-populina 98AG31]|uniref:Uncharacterized protein n=1 Tax=Melampsora larici-populina (strain 98AG31 / pathotype 3-4-7) TaxID=747676 RepID=F4R9S0_MELLP|nr:uncharacterized protein MELLADRAFT_70927 [Melampsora larici-populina 98AG31]EGG11029.1 hypothetical protein MELLADRAFT_70927 [Melampsora larici-populina 98AG31]
MGSSRPVLNVKSKSLPIFSHARDPSIPRICLSPDSDEEEEGHDQSDETQSEPPTSAIPIMLDTSGLLSANPTMERSLDFKCALIATTTSSSPPSNSSNHRAVQRQALLANLALARRRRTTTTTTMTNEKSTPQFVAPV